MTFVGLRLSHSEASFTVVFHLEDMQACPIQMLYLKDPVFWLRERSRTHQKKFKLRRMSYSYAVHSYQRAQEESRVNDGPLGPS